MVSLQNSPSIHRTLVPSSFSQTVIQKQGNISCCRRSLPLLVRAEQVTDSASSSLSHGGNSEVDGQCKRRPLLLGGIGALTTSLSLLPAASLLAQEAPANFESFVDLIDGYSYYYPSDWREFDFRGHDSAFKDRYLQLQGVRVRFIPTDKQDIHDMGPLEEVVNKLVKTIYAAPNQLAYIYDMREKEVNGKNYYTFEYMLRSPIFSCTSFTTIAVANGRFYTLIVGANDRRWRRVRNKLKVVADSFRVLDI